MANPQLEDGYTKIANPIQDALCGFRVPGELRQILDFILRKTFGWNKTEDAISMSQFVELTHMKKPNIVRAIKKLSDHSIIFVRKDGINSIPFYKLNKDYEQWKHFTKVSTDCSVIKSDNEQEGPSEEDPTRKPADITTETGELDRVSVIKSDNEPGVETGPGQTTYPIVLIGELDKFSDLFVIRSDNGSKSDAVIKSDNASLSEVIMPVIKTDNASLSKLIPTKETTTKKTITKETYTKEIGDGFFLSCPDSEDPADPKPKKSKKSPVERKEFVLPDFIPVEVWENYMKGRDKKKAVNTPYALNRIIGKLIQFQNEYGHGPIDVLNRSIDRGWIDVFPLENGGNGHGKTRQQAGDWQRAPEAYHVDRF